MLIFAPQLAVAIYYMHPGYVFGLVLLLAESQPLRTAARTAETRRRFGAWLAGVVQ